MTPSAARIPIRAHRPVPHERSLPNMVHDVSQLDVTIDVPLPQSPDAERAVLGAILINNNVMYRLGELTADHFFKDAHRMLFSAMALMAEERMEIEPLTLKEELWKRGRLDQVGGVEYISALLDMVPDVANVERYVAYVVRAYKKRALIIAGNALMRSGLDPETEPEEVAAAAMAALSPQATRDDAQSRTLADVLSDAYARQRALAAADRGPSFDCGWPTLNTHKVFFPTLVICTADRGAGKSALMAAWAKNFGANGHPVAMFTLESAEQEIGLRYTSMETGIPHRFVRDWRTFDERNHRQIAECQRIAAGRPIFANQRLKTLEEIVLEIRRLKAMHGLQVALIDYIQLMRVRGKFDRDELKWAHISQELLHAALELDVTICAFSQVNKQGEVAYADSIEKSARVRMHFERPDGGCKIDFSIIKNNEERTHPGFAAHFDEVSQQWGEGTCEENDCRSLRVAQRPLL